MDKINGISPIIREKAPLILAEIKKSHSILLHCHPSPDPDSVGAALAMRYVLEQLGKSATVIQGDSEIPQAFMHFPGARDIVSKNYFEIDLEKFDLFIILDSAAPYMVSRRGEVVFPPTLRTIVIDHHITSTIGGDMKLIEPGYPSVCQVLYDLFQEWNIKMTPEIAQDLFIGLYCDTGGFQYEGTTVKTYEIASDLARQIPNIPQLISPVKNSETSASMRFLGMSLSAVETFLGDRIAISAISNDILVASNISEDDVSLSEVSSLLNRVSEWEIAVSAVEFEKGKVKVSFRSKDPERYDVSKLAQALRGGGHRTASGALLPGSIEEVVKIVVAKAKELYNL